MKINLFTALEILKASTYYQALDLSHVHFVDADTGVLGALEPPFMISIDLCDSLAGTLMDQFDKFLNILNHSTHIVVFNEQMIADIKNSLEKSNLPVSFENNHFSILFYCAVSQKIAEEVTITQRPNITYPKIKFSIFMLFVPLMYLFWRFRTYYSYDEDSTIFLTIPESACDLKSLMHKIRDGDNDK